MLQKVNYKFLHIVCIVILNKIKSIKEILNFNVDLVKWEVQHYHSFETNCFKLVLFYDSYLTDFLILISVVFFL